MSYEHILLVTDLMSDADVVAQKAKRIVENRPNAKLSVLHIVKDTMVGFGYELVPASSLYDEIDDERCRSEERRVGKECRFRWSQMDYIKNDDKVRIWINEISK